MKRRKFRQILAFLLSITMLCGMLSGCKAASESENASGGSQSNEDALVVLCSTVNQRLASLAGVEFTAKTGIKVELRTINANSDTWADDYQQEFNKLMLGNAADVLLIDNLLTRACNVPKAQEAGAFVDIQKLLDADADYQRADYYTAVIDSMKHRDALYLMPLRYDIWALVSEKSVLEQYGFDTEQCSTGRGLLEQVGAYCDRFYADETLPTLFPYSDYWFSCLYDEMQLNPLNYAAQTVDWSADNQAFLDCYRKIYDADENASTERYYSSKAAMDYERIELGECLFMGGMPHDDNYIFGWAKQIQNIGEPVILPVYSWDGTGVSAQVVLSAAISQISQKQEAAYQYIRCLMGEEVQKKLAEAQQYTPSGMSVNRNVVQMELDKIGVYDTATAQDGSELPALDSGLIDTYIGLLEQINYAYVETEAEGSDVMQMFVPYLTGEKSYETVFDKADSQLNIYISE